MDKKSKKNFQLIHLVFMFSLGLAVPVYAVDGVIEINQARALAGGVTPGDTAGFPVSIRTPGSYRLTGNLTVSATDVDAIDITTNVVVTLDLNGFAIIGPGSGIGIGVNASGPNVIVFNGIVHNMGGIGVVVGNNCRVEKIHAFQNGGTGIESGDSSIVSGNMASSNGGNGIESGDGSIVSGNMASSNGGNGIKTGTRSIVSGNTANNNGDRGIETFVGCTVSGNVAGGNGKAGIRVQSGTIVVGNAISENSGAGLNLVISGSTSGYTDNVIIANNGGNSNPQVFSGIEIGTNICGDDTTCP